ncbi:MAG: UTP--glucose-1-phosphate uridylyltransferase GalU [bacterium]|nr:UTP--glucose-1-phosphate uridylyltransferase GalU [bacterium]
MKIKKVVIPVGGFGTRFLPATKAQPKEMLTIVDKPVIQYLVEEAVASGIKEIIFVTGRGKRAIEDHFDYSAELEHFLNTRGKHDLAKKIHEISSLARFTYVRQGEPKGPGHALLQISHLIGHDEPVAVLYGDDIIDAKVPCLKQLIDIYEKTNRSVIALQKIPKKEISRYGVIGGKKIAPRTHKITELVEKPAAEDAPSDLAIVGKYIYTPDLFQMLSTMKPGPGGELYPTEVFDAYIKNGGEIYGYEYEGVRYDCGDKLGFLQAIVQFGLKHPEVGKGLKSYLKGLDL